jgi:hypothetical protein
MPYLNLFLMFVASFLLEICSTWYTIACSRELFRTTIVLSALHEVLAWGIVIVVVSDLSLAPTSILGTVFGTAAALSFSKRKHA